VTPLPAHLELVPYESSASISVAPATRTCASCGRRLAKSSHPTRRTCSKRCRQKLSRANTKVSRKVSHDRVVARHVLTAAARSRIGLEVETTHAPAPTETSAPQQRRGFVSGRISKGVRIE
jgi:hypothetical protein